jgi:hypothetical protein
MQGIAPAVITLFLAVITNVAFSLQSLPVRHLFGLNALSCV